jgi:hypothetical protein
MLTILKTCTRSWFWRSAAMLSLVLLSFQPASADNSVATITLFAPGATAGARVVVQYQGASGDWFAVSGWESTLDKTTDSGVPFEQWSVYQADFGQGPFRWAVYQADGKTLWAISNIFNLPPGGGLDQSETITSANIVSVTPAVQQALSQAAKVPVLNAGSSVWSTSCTDCESHAHITAYVSGLPVNSWIVVQWQDGFGNWVTVPGWQGTAQKLYDQGVLKDWTTTGTGTLFQQWTVVPDNYGQGPFRWAIYSGPNGTLLGVSPNFNLPTMDGADNILYLTE